MADPIRKLTAMIALTFTPKDEVVSGSWAQARMARPVRVFGEEGPEKNQDREGNKENENLRFRQMEAADGKVTQADTGVVGQRMGSGNDAKGLFHGGEEADGYDERSDPGQMKKGRV